MNRAVVTINPPQESPLRVLLADDHMIFRQGLRLLLQRQGMDVVAEAGDGLEAVQLAQAQRPDVAVLDYGMPGLNGIAAAREILKRSPRTQTILLSMYEDEEANALEALRAGMHGYVLKSQGAEELVNTIREVSRGAIHISSGATQAALDAYGNGAKVLPDPLTERERQILLMIADGKTSRDISAALLLSAKTVESHRSHIMHKLKIHRTADLIRYAVRRHLVRP